MASIRDVARTAGVSSATVSNVLNGRSERVSEATVEKVLATVRALKYRPTPLEHRQKTIQTRNVGFNVTDMTAAAFRNGGYHQEILHGVLEGAASRGYSLTVFVEKIWDDVGLAIRRTYDGRCDGLVMVAPQPGNEVIEMLHARGTPIVTVGSTPWLPNISSVDIDNHLVGALAARHLYDLGHRRLAFVVDGRPQVSAKERQEGFFQGARKLGVAEENLVCVETIEAPRGDEPDFIIDALMRAPRPTAAFFWHDGLAGRTVARLRERGFRIPDELSIISVDNSHEATEFGLTTFKNPTYELGIRAAKVLIDRIDDADEASVAIRFAPEFVLRTTTGRLR